MAVLPNGARVLLVRLSALGDVIFALETLASLKHERPDVRADFLVEDRCAGLLYGHPQIERVLAFPRHRKLAIPGAVRALRAVRYDAVLDLHGILKSAWQVRLARAERRIGYAAPGSREGAQRCYGERVVLPDPLPHRAEMGYHLLRALGLHGAPARPVLPAPGAAPRFWGERRGGRIVLHPGASAFAAFKRWPVARFASVARRLVAQGHEVAVSHGPGEAELCAAVRAEAPQARALDGGALGLAGLAAVYREADLMIAADTGPLHLAAAAGTRVIALFGPKDPARYGPRGAGHRALYHEVPCRPCRLRWCPAPLCVLGIQVEEVMTAIGEALAR